MKPKKIFYNHIAEICSIDLAESSDYKTSKIEGYRYKFVMFDHFSKYFRFVPLKNKNAQT